MYSFDVFNTLITRATATPYGIFSLMGNYMLKKDLGVLIPFRVSNNFPLLRIQAENLARYHNQMRGIEEVTLKEIYQVLSMAEELTEDAQNWMIQLEQETELSHVFPIRENIVKLKQLVARGEYVIIISDMYLPVDIIRQMLKKADDIFDRIPLYVSSELAVRKTTGNLYRKIQKIENIDYKDWTHIGDDKFQDIQVPKTLGIRTIQIKLQPFMTHEKRFLKRFPYQSMLQLLIGAARYTRHTHQIRETSGRVGSSLCGPVIYSYMTWVLNKCVQKGIQRLYFIARDGYLPKIVADKIIAKKRMKVETYYIYGSRKAWRACSLSEEDFRLFEFIAWSYPQRIDTTEKLAKVLEMSLEELMPFLPYGSREGNTELSIQARFEIAKQLEQNKRFKQFYLNKQEQKKKLVVEYICQEVCMDDDNFAFVDVAGGGYTQSCLKRILNETYRKPIQTFFFKMDRINQTKDCIYYVFFPSRIPNDLIIEMMFRAPHGQTIGYKKIDEKVIPILDEIENKSLMQHGFGKLQETLELFTEQMLMISNINDELMDSMDIVEAYFRYISSYPDREILEYFATFPNNETGQKETTVEYAPKLTNEDILNIFLRKMDWEHINKYYKGTNISYSLLRCNAEEKQLIKKCQKEYYSEWGLGQRAAQMSVEKRLTEIYGNAAFYPCELLEERIILYGAGRFGRKLYKRIRDLNKSKIIKWVDKYAQKHIQYFGKPIEPIDSILNVNFEQVVIAVMDEDLAKEIRQELVQKGILENKIFWIQIYGYKNPEIIWEQ